MLCVIVLFVEIQVCLRISLSHKLIQRHPIKIYSITFIWIIYVHSKGLTWKGRSMWFCAVFCTKRPTIISKYTWTPFPLHYDGSVHHVDPCLLDLVGRNPRCDAKELIFIDKLYPKVLYNLRRSSTIFLQLSVLFFPKKLQQTLRKTPMQFSQFCSTDSPCVISPVSKIPSFTFPSLIFGNFFINYANPSPLQSIAIKECFIRPRGECVWSGDSDDIMRSVMFALVTGLDVITFCGLCCPT